MGVGGAESPTSIQATCSSCGVLWTGFTLVPWPKSHTLSEGPVVSSVVPITSWSSFNTYVKWRSGRNDFRVLKTALRTEPLHDERG